MKKLLLFVIFISLYSCSGDDLILNSDNPKIYKALQKKKQEYASEIWANCRKEALIRADQYVDSLISTEIAFQLSDSIVFPQKPPKPQSLGKIILTDTSKAKPIFRKQ
ncbi:MAG: hypothetical protein H7X99_09920 [Saprospiraceae bacterium]|nr:hypothetical protein [Saprospiraceae bacterium]